MPDAPKPRRAAPAASPSRSGYPESVERLMTELATLPGIGRRSAERLAFHILKAPAHDARRLSVAIDDVKRLIRHCRVCYNLTDWTDAPRQGADPQQTRPDAPAPSSRSAPTLCAICAEAASAASDSTPSARQVPTHARDAALVMVVEQPKDLIALEQTNLYRGVYHVLMGRISPLEGVGPADLTVADLLRRVDDPDANAGAVPIREVVLALNPTLEGDGTALFLAQELVSRGVAVTRLARGLPVGSTLEFASKAVLADAIQGRQSMTS